MANEIAVQVIFNNGSPVKNIVLCAEYWAFSNGSIIAYQNGKTNAVKFQYVDKIFET